LANANFLPEFNCNTNDSAIFENYSTYGSNVQYLWDFGYAGQTSTTVAPKFRYPALATDQTYNVKLVVRNNGCGGKDSSIVPILIPARPNLNLGPDKISCTGAAVTLNATSWTGATYLWQDGSTNATYNATAIDVNYYNVAVSFNGCVRKDTIMVSISPIVPKKENFILCANDSILLNSYRGFGETYLWNNNATTNSIYAFNPGLFVNRLKWNTCFIRDTFKISAPKSPFANIDTTICFPFQSFSLDVTTPNATSYTWNNGTTGANHTFPSSGINWVNINYGNCSRRDTFNVLVAPAPVTLTNNVKICQGNNYTLPWGPQVNIPGNYRDTLKNLIGCDSLIKSYNLSIQIYAEVTFNATFCTDSTYTLPWGSEVLVPGIYRDTLHYTTGCDSVRRTVNLVEQTFTTNVLNPIICIGNTYTLPWATVVNSSGTYRDTLRYTTGCDSLRRIVNLTVQPFTTQVTNPIICIGQTYTLPWGTVVNATGTYRDTLYYTTGCDSVRRTVNLLVQTFAEVTINATFCTDSTYTLPWGTVVNTTGIYRDTLVYTTGCDSIRRTVNLTEQTFTTSVLNPIICIGDRYTLPWGVLANATGIYRDTLRYTTGCDSLRRVVNLTVQSYRVQTQYDTICSGHDFLLPWGGLVSTSGTYTDTLQFTSGCDSLRRYVFLNVTPPVSINNNISICENENYTLPWGQIVNQAGIYFDTVVTASGCDSLVRIYNLSVKPIPVISITKSNDINCVLGLAQINATGATQYDWTPEIGLNNAHITNPLAFPTNTTLYKLKATGSNGCTIKDSITIFVSFEDPGNAYLVPNSFTPNNDGLNDCFGVSFWGKVTEFSFSVFNRWGRRVFYTTNSMDCWDGKFNGTMVDLGSYSYIIKGKGNCGKINRRGMVIMIR
jgi:gliding motility-associated-like protein